MDKTVLIAFSLTLIAGLSTGIGSLISFFAKKTNTKMLSFSLGLSAGVMIYVSFVEMLPNAFELLENEYAKTGTWYSVLAFFVGIAISLIIDKLVPEKENPHEVRFVESMNKEVDKSKLHRLGVITAIAITSPIIISVKFSVNTYRFTSTSFTPRVLIIANSSLLLRINK